MRSYLLRHWRGESSLAVAWWVGGIGITALSLALERFAQGVELPLESPAGFSAFVILGLTLLLLVPAWQVIGLFRAADRHAGEVGTILAARIVQGLTTILAILLAIRLLAFAGEVAPGVRLAWRMGGSGYQVGITHGGRVLEVRGGILYGLADESRRLLDGNPGVRRLRLNSGGGSLAEARRLRELVLARRLDTDSTLECASACVSVFIAGQHRYLHRAARLGFHLPRNPGFGFRSPVRPEYAEELAYFARRGVPQWFRQRMVASGRQFWYPTPAQLRLSGFVQVFYGAPRPGEAFYYR
jgi:hypothetical protein